jgi:hypothetical protein
MVEAVLPGGKEAKGRQGKGAGKLLVKVKTEGVLLAGWGAFGKTG